ncbi:MAG: membrane protein insertase YidC [bacterium]|nr:membrane protein insertase YidC [bacterium]
MRSLYYDPVADDLETLDAGDAEEGPVGVSGRYSFAGIEDSYFAAVAIPDNGSSFDLTTFADTAAVGPEATEQPHTGVAFGGRGKNAFPVYVGPKDVDLLKETDPRLGQLVDFGFFSILAKPLFIVLKYLHDNVVANYGWSIVLITVAINFLTLPLKFTSLKSMRKMQALQPLIKQINEKYKGVGMRDPKKSQQNEEMMALYKKHGVNPMGGCMPMLLQIPFFFAFYSVLNIAIELRGADWLWVGDLSQPETLPIHILPIVMTLSQFAMQKMTPTTTPDPNQQRMMMLMPLMFLFFFYNVSAGLVLYWLTSNLVGVAQQLLFNKFIPLDTTAITEAATTSKSKKRRSGKSR